MSNEKTVGRISALNALIEERLGADVLARMPISDEELAAHAERAKSQAPNLLAPERWKDAPVYQSPLRDADGNEVFVTIFLDGLIKRPIDASEETMTKVPWVEPKSDLPDDARERLKSMDAEKLEDLIEWFDGSPHFTDLLAYAKAVLRGRVPLEDRIVCSRCSALYEGWTKDDDEWSNGVALCDGWQEVEYRCGDGRNFDDTDWKTLCPNCPPTPEEVAEQKACRAYTARIIKQMRKKDAERAKKASS